MQGEDPGAGPELPNGKKVGRGMTKTTSPDGMLAKVTGSSAVKTGCPLN